MINFIFDSSKKLKYQINIKRVSMVSSNMLKFFMRQNNLVRTISQRNSQLNADIRYNNYLFGKSIYDYNYNYDSKYLVTNTIPLFRKLNLKELEEFSSNVYFYYTTTDKDILELQKIYNKILNTRCCDIINNSNYNDSYKNKLINDLMRCDILEQNYYIKFNLEQKHHIKLNFEMNNLMTITQNARDDELSHKYLIV